MKPAEALRNNLIAAIRVRAEYWARQPGLTNLERCHGVAFSILAILDGCTDSGPAFDLAADGVVIREMLHERYD